MRFALSASVLSLAASAVAFSVTFPTKTDTWTTNGPNTFKWTSVSTDAANFTLVLKNQDQSYQQVLASLVDATLGTLSVNAPSTGFPIGTDLQLDMVQDATHLTSILAQSPEFAIVASVSSSSSSHASSTTVSTGTTATGSSAAATTKASATGTTAGSSGGELNPTTSSSGTSPSGAANAAVPLGAQSGLVSAVAAVFGAIAYML